MFYQEFCSLPHCSKGSNSRHNLKAGHKKWGLGFFKMFFPSLMQYFHFIKVQFAILMKKMINLSAARTLHSK